MFSLFLSTVLNLFIFFVVGTFISKLFKHRTYTFDQIFLGLVGANTLVSFLSLFFPINLKILLVITVTCVVATALMKEQRNEIKHKIIRHKKVFLYSFPFLLMSFFISLGPQANYDSGLYHVQAIKWIQEYAVVPGLANLHSRFGFNPNLFSLNALASLKVLFDQEIYSLNFTVYAILAVYYVKRLFTTSIKYGISNLLFFYVVIFYESLKLYPSLSSPTPDFLAISLTYFAFSRVIDLGLEGEVKSFKHFIPIFILIVYLITVKLSTIPLLGLPAGLIIYYRPKPKKIVQSLLLGLIVLIPWLSRNVILTGYLVFPLEVVDIFNFDWEVPEWKLTNLEKQIKGWGRMPGPEHMSFSKLPFDEWFPLWWERLNISKKILFLGSLFGPALLLISRSFNNRKGKIEFYAVTLTSLLGVIFWLMTAPDFRFGGAFVTIAFFSPFLFMPFSLRARINTENLSIFTIILLVIQFYRITYLNNKEFLLKLPNATVFQQKQQPAFLEFETYKIDNIEIYVPHNDERCFDHALPCADPYNRIDLIEIRKGSLQSGFKPISDF